VGEMERSHRVKEEKNNLHTMKRRKANLIGLILCMNWIVRHITEAKIEERLAVTGQRGRGLSSYWMTLRKGEDTAS
jgi:hypothetical protein